MPPSVCVPGAECEGVGDPPPGVAVEAAEEELVTLPQVLPEGVGVALAGPGVWVKVTMALVVGCRADAVPGGVRDGEREALPLALPTPPLPALAVAQALALAVPLPPPAAGVEEVQELGLCDPNPREKEAAALNVPLLPLASALPVAAAPVAEALCVPLPSCEEMLTAGVPVMLGLKDVAGEEEDAKELVGVALPPPAPAPLDAVAKVLEEVPALTVAPRAALSVPVEEGVWGMAEGLPLPSAPGVLLSKGDAEEEGDAESLGLLGVGDTWEVGEAGLEGDSVDVALAKPLVVGTGEEDGETLPPPEGEEEEEPTAIVAVGGEEGVSRGLTVELGLPREETDPPKDAVGEALGLAGVSVALVLSVALPLAQALPVGSKMLPVDVGLEVRLAPAVTLGAALAEAGAVALPKAGETLAASVLLGVCVGGALVLALEKGEGDGEGL